MGFWKPLGGGRSNDDIFICAADEPIGGRPLRCLLIDLLAAAGVPMSISQLVGELERLNTPLAGRPSKAVSDALRWEIRNGRVERVGRGRYRFLGAPPTTLARITRRARSVRRHLAERSAQPSSGDSIPTAS